MRARFVFFLLVLVLLSGCSSIKQVLFPDEYSGTDGGIYLSPIEKARLQRYEDGHNAAMMRDRDDR